MVELLFVAATVCAVLGVVLLFLSVVTQASDRTQSCVRRLILFGCTRSS